VLRRTKVYLRGAYGPGNLGDDVLLLCMIKLLKRQFKSNDISISINDVTAAKHIDKDVNWVPLNAPVFSDVAILGGGGQFFSFFSKSVTKTERSDVKSWLMKKHQQGYTFFDLLIGFILRKVLGIGYKTKKLATFCIGVGPFENGRDDEYIRALKIFEKADFLSVRDSKSKIQVSEMCGKIPAQFVDITLNRELWYDKKQDFFKQRNLNSKPVVGIVIREWSLNDSGCRVINELLEFDKLNPNYDCVYISFYKKYDKQIIDRLKGKKVLIWEPKEDTVNSFLTKMKQSCDVIISTRAHGVLLSTMVYIPTIAVEIEQKIKVVHQMMPTSTKLVKGDSLDLLANNVELCLNYDDEYKKRVDNDLQKNSIVAKASIVKLEEWLRNVK